MTRVLCLLGRPATCPHWGGAGPCVCRQRSDELEADALRRPAAWWDGANQAEVEGFALSSVNMPDGSGIPGLPDQELRRQLAVAASRLRDRTTRTKWLERYAGRLVAEAEARKAEDTA